VCSGDWDLAQFEGTLHLHDDDEDSGLVMHFQPNTQLTIYVHWQGVCDAFYPQQVEAGIQRFINDNIDHGCNNGCTHINIKRFTDDGTIVADYWVPQPPPGITITPSTPLTPTPNWTWVCSGDFDIIYPDGRREHLHDDNPSTSLVLKLIPASQLKIATDDWNGYCEPFYQGAADSAIVNFIQNAFTNGCAPAPGCTRIRKIVLDPVGNMLQDEWVDRPSAA
jgi:hypothetical protein